MSSNQIKINFGIDCNPFCRHQDEAGKHIFENILKREYKGCNNKSFGCWDWESIPATEEQNKEIALYLYGLYSKGYARGIMCSNLKRYVVV